MARAEWWVWSLGLLSCSTASAQDMQLGLEDTDPQGTVRGSLPEDPVQRSEALVRGLAHYDAERFAQAAVLLQRVIEGQTGDGRPAVQQAQFYLAKAFVHLGFDHAALALLDEITHDGRAHPYFVQTLPWLYRAARNVPDRDVALALVGRFEQGDLEQAGTALDADALSGLLLMMGEHAFREGQVQRALGLLHGIDSASREGLRARFLEGVAHVRQRHVKPAVAAFREIVERVDAGDTQADDAARMRDLAWLSLGRAYYTAALTGHDAKQEGALLGNAVHAWSQIDQSSEHWLDALFESAWALFVSDEHARALGNLHALLSPYFRDALYPEAHLLKSVIYFHGCQMDNADAALRTFHERYDPLRDALRELLERDADGAQALALFAAPGSPELSAKAPSLAAVLSRKRADRELLRALGELDALEREAHALASAPSALRESTAGERIHQDILVARSLAEVRARELARARASRLLEELSEVANQADTVEIEMLNWRRHRLGTRPVVASAEGRSVEVDSEHQLWPFDGEYWRDELGYYRQAITNRCEAR